jgi:hypothetical protein
MFHLIFYIIQKCLIWSLPVMKCGVFNMTQKQNDRACSGKHRIHLGQNIMHVSLTDQENGCVFLRSQWDSSLWIHCKWTNGESAVLFGSNNKVTGIYNGSSYRAKCSTMFVTCLTSRAWNSRRKIPCGHDSSNFSVRFLMSLPSMATHYSLKHTVFWIAMSCNFKRDQYCLHLQGWIVS